MIIGGYKFGAKIKIRRIGRCSRTGLLGRGEDDDEKGPGRRKWTRTEEGEEAVDTDVGAGVG